MAEQQSKPVESASAAPGEKRSASRPLAKASESGDPAVHKLLADKQAAAMNLAATEATPADEDKAKARDELKRATDALADLGFE